MFLVPTFDNLYSSKRLYISWTFLHAWDSLDWTFQGFIFRARNLGSQVIVAGCLYCDIPLQFPLLHGLHHLKNLYHCTRYLNHSPDSSLRHVPDIVQIKRCSHFWDFWSMLLTFFCYVSFVRTFLAITFALIKLITAYILWTSQFAKLPSHLMWTGMKSLWTPKSTGMAIVLWWICSMTQFSQARPTQYYSWRCIVWSFKSSVKFLEVCRLLLYIRTGQSRLFRVNSNRGLV